MWSISDFYSTISLPDDEGDLRRGAFPSAVARGPSILWNAPVVPVTCEDEFARAVRLGLVARHAPGENQVLVTSEEHGPVILETSEHGAIDLRAPLEAVRVWTAVEPDGGVLPGDAVVVGMAFRYRGDACFRPAAPDPAEDARIRGRDPYVFEAATLTLGAGERVVGATWKSEFEYVKQITFTTSRGRVHAFGAACPRAPAFVDAASEGGAALVGFRGLREVYASHVAWERCDPSAVGDPRDCFGGGPFTPTELYFSNAWTRRRCPVLVRELCKLSRASQLPKEEWSEYTLARAIWDLPLDSARLFAQPEAIFRRIILFV
mmetsp:Transcript_30627/g.94845  ORF Transcript_30627/g.94845 Transcript_30627/m.94845 type:complete len:320 (+) Transcript_30627:169-1128(+)